VSSPFPELHAAQIGQLKGDANAYLTDPNYATLRLRLENATPLWRP
jgi:hypothetical protein